MERRGFVDVQVMSFANLDPLRDWARLFPMPASIKPRILEMLVRDAIGRLPIPMRVGNLAILATRARPEQ